MGQKGLSIAELLIVVAILGIFSTLALPKIGQTLADREIDNAARLLISDLRYLQQMCINSAPGSQIPVMLFSQAPAGYIIAKGGFGIKTVNFPSRVRISSSPKEITFGLNGTPMTDNKPFPTTITLSTKEGKLKYVIIAKSGRIRLSNVNDTDSTAERI